MACGAAEPDNHKKQITRFIVKAAAVLMLAAAPYLIFCGLPLAGLPDADEVTRVEITRIDDGLSKCATNAKAYQNARRMQKTSSSCAKPQSFCAMRRSPYRVKKRRALR